MIRSAASKVMWVGRATVFLVGLAVILALLFGVASMALGANGNPFILGKANNTASKVTGLVGNVADTTKAALKVTNTKGGSALELKVTDPDTTDPALKDTAPMTVDSQAQVANLNADELDGVNSTGFLQNGAAAGGDLTGTYPGPQIANGAVAGGPGGKIADNTIAQNDIATSGVGSAEVANDSLSIITDVQGDSVNQQLANFNNFTIPAQGCTIDTVNAAVAAFDMGDLIVTEVSSGTLPDGIYIPAYVVTKEDTWERILCNATASNISLNDQFIFVFHKVR